MPLLCIHVLSLANEEEFKIRIAFNEEVMQQNLSIALSPAFEFESHKTAMTILENLSSQ